MVQGMNRKERREFIRQNKDISTTCPICKKKTVFKTGSEIGYRICIVSGCHVVKEGLE